MNWRLPQPLLVFSLLLCAALPAPASGASPVDVPPIDAQASGNNPAAPSPAAAQPAPTVPTTPAAPTVPAPPIPVPTDQTPPVVAVPSPIPLGQSLLVSGAADVRYRTATIGRSHQAWLNDVEIDFNRPLTYKTQAIGNVKLQIIGENPPDVSHTHDVQIGEAYVLYKLPFQTQTDSTAYLKIGQFQLPFALLAVYDPHLQILQPLYQQSLGLRNDFGVDISGRSYGLLNYDFALTDGSGPGHIDLTGNQVVTFRLGRTFVTRNGTVNVGGSLLQGRLPITDITAAHPLPFELPPTGDVDADRGFVSKTRIAGDGTITLKGLTARGEAMIGADQNSRVEGYFAEVDYRFSPRMSVLGARSVWDYPADNSLTDDDALGVTYAAGANLSFSALEEDIYDVPVGAPRQTIQRFTVQALFRF